MSTYTLDELDEVTVFTNGDSGKISTWSNIPYFFVDTLVSRGVKVNQVDLSPSPILKTCFLPLLFFIKIIYKYTTYNYFRSPIHFIDIKRRIIKATKEYKNSQINIFLTFSFSSSGITKAPTVQLGDWPYIYIFDYFLNRKPDILEKSSIRREDEQIEGSDIVISLFPDIAKFMQNHYKKKNIYYLGNVINSNQEAKDDQLLEKKAISNNLLFIGKRKYLEGARYLIKAFIILKKIIPELRLDIVGMKDSEIGDLPAGVRCYGYLDKGNDTDRKIFYSLLENAKVLINTTPKWAGFSSTIEAMHFYTPVVVSPYTEFIETFGKDIDFGFYCDDNSTDILCKNILSILEHPSYRELCINAHESVKGFSWDNYIEKLLELIRETRLIN